MLPRAGEEAPAAYLLVRLAPHPPSWHIRQQHPWVPPFAYGGTATRHPAVVISGGGHREQRWAFAGSSFGLAHFPIVLLSLCPVVAYFLLMAAYQRRSALYTLDSAEGCARDVRDPGPEELPMFTGGAGKPLQGWWAAQWSALMEDDNVQVAISSLSAAAASNVFYSPGTARKNKADDHEPRGQEAGEEAKQPGAGEAECIRSPTGLPGKRRRLEQDVNEIHQDEREPANDKPPSPFPLSLSANASRGQARRRRRRRRRRDKPPLSAEDTDDDMPDPARAIINQLSRCAPAAPTDDGIKEGTICSGGGFRDGRDDGDGGGGGGDGGTGGCSSRGRRGDGGTVDTQRARSDEPAARSGREASSIDRALGDVAIHGGEKMRGMENVGLGVPLTGELVLSPIRECPGGIDDGGSSSGGSRVPERGDSSSGVGHSKRARTRRRIGTGEDAGTNEVEAKTDAGATRYRLPFGL
ncbi:unnamed protein product [Scytosiphon promiscuus]